MNKLISLYNQNRFVFIVIIIIVLLIIVFIQVLNSIVKDNLEQNAIAVNEIRANEDKNQDVFSSNVSVITGETVQNNERYVRVIENFVNYCNNGEIENAYNMLTEECRKLVYPSLEYFKTYYYDRIFTEKRMYSLENWFVTPTLKTYHIKYIGDILATGKVETTDVPGDYITVERVASSNCLNISEYIGSKEINKKETKNGITITVGKMYMYMDYTILNLKVKNQNNTTIMIDTKEKTDTLYVYDSNGVRFSSFLNENAEEGLKVRKGMQSDIMIKFNKMYNPDSKSLIGIKLKDVVTNYDEYSQGTAEKRTLEFDIGL